MNEGLIDIMALPQVRRMWPARRAALTVAEMASQRRGRTGISGGADRHW